MEFIKNRTARSDSDFLESIDTLPEYSQTLLAVRNAVADHSKVPPSVIYADDRFGWELLSLGSWGSLDRFELIFVLEKWLEVELTKLTIDRLPDPDRDSCLTVGDFAKQIAELINEADKTKGHRC